MKIQQIQVGRLYPNIQSIPTPHLNPCFNQNSPEWKDFHSVLIVRIKQDPPVPAPYGVFWGKILVFRVGKFQLF